MFRRWLPICLLLLPFPKTSAAQSVGGEIAGQVLDQRGSAIPAALVQVVNTSTGQIRALSTDDKGRYQALEIPPGRYDLTILRGGFNTARVPGVQVGVAETVRLEDVALTVAPVGSETIGVKAVAADLIETDTPAASSAFNAKQIRELPILTRDVNNLALLSPGVVSVRSFSFASTLVPFSVSGSRGRENNFIVDSVDNNEPLFGGAAAQFTNTDLFTEYRILTGQFKAEYGRNSGSVINAITDRGGNRWHGSGFGYLQRDALNATSLAERDARLSRPLALEENVLGATLGGALRRDSTWMFVSYQRDAARQDLSPAYPQIVTLPTTDGLNALSGMPQTATLAAYLSNPTVRLLPQAGATCASFAGNPNPCTAGAMNVNGTPVPFGTYLVPGSGVFNLRDHQFSGRLDHKLSQRDDLSGRYLFDDIATPRKAGASPIDVGFSDPGLLPEYRERLAQRTQNAGAFWTHAWTRALHEFRVSGTRIATRIGALGVNEATRETVPAVTVSDNFAPNVAGFPSSGSVFTLGRDTRPAAIASTLGQVQDNVSIMVGRHSLKFGANFVRTWSNIRDNPSDLGQYFYFVSGAPGGLQNFVNNQLASTGNGPAAGLESFPNLGGRGGEVLPLREFSQFYFAQDDYRARENLTLSFGLRYENFGQPINRLAELNPAFGTKLSSDQLDFGPRLGFAWGIGNHSVIRGGTGVYYDPTELNIPLVGWQGGRNSPFVVGVPTNVYPQQPFLPSDALRHVTDCDSLTLDTSANPTGPTFTDCTSQDAIVKNLRQQRTYDYALGLQRQMGSEFLFDVSYGGTAGTRLFQRIPTNPRTGWIFPANCAPACAVAAPRLNPNRGEVNTITNGAHSSYHSLQVSATKRYQRPGAFSGLALTAAYTWSHAIDNASEIFGPDVRRLRDFRFLRQNASPIEVITPFPEDVGNTTSAERANSSFDRRHRGSMSFVWALPEPREQRWRMAFGGWELSGVFSAQTGQPFSPLNSFGACTDANGDGVLTSDRPSIGNPRAPITSVALLADPSCVNPSQGYVDLSGNPVDPANAHFVQNPLGVKTGQAFQVGSETFIAGNAGRNTLLGPNTVNLDLAVLKTMRLSERTNVQFRFEAYDILNHANPGNLLGSPYLTDAQAVPALAFGPVLPGVTPARVSGVIPENSLDAFAPSGAGLQPLFLSRQFMNTSSRRLQASLKLLF